MFHHNIGYIGIAIHCECKKEQIDKIEKEHLVIEREHLGKAIFDKVQTQRKFAKEEQRIRSYNWPIISGLYEVSKNLMNHKVHMILICL